MAQSTMLHVRVDDEIKTQASVALAAMGLSVSDAVRILLMRVVNDQAFPLELKVPNAQTRAAMEEARAMAKARTTRFWTAQPSMRSCLPWPSSTVPGGARQPERSKPTGRSRTCTTHFSSARKIPRTSASH